MLHKSRSFSCSSYSKSEERDSISLHYFNERRGSAPSSYDHYYAQHGGALENIPQKKLLHRTRKSVENNTKDISESEGSVADKSDLLLVIKKDNGKNKKKGRVEINTNRKSTEHSISTKGRRHIERALLFPRNQTDSKKRNEGDSMTTTRKAQATFDDFNKTNTEFGGSPSNILAPERVLRNIVSESSKTSITQENFISQAAQQSENVDGTFEIHYVAPKYSGAIKNSVRIGRKLGIAEQTVVMRSMQEKGPIKFGNDSVARGPQLSAPDQSVNADKQLILRDKDTDRRAEEEKESTQRRRRWSYSLRQLMKKDNQVVKSLQTRLLQRKNSKHETLPEYLEIDMNNTETLTGIQEALSKFSQNLEGLKEELRSITTDVNEASTIFECFKKDKTQFEEMATRFQSVSDFHEIELLDSDDARQRFKTM